MRARVASALLELELDGFDAVEELAVFALDPTLDLLDRAHHRGVVLAAETLAELRVARLEPLPAQVHRDHARIGDRAMPPVRAQVRHADVEVVADRVLDVLDARAVLLARQLRAQRLLGELEIDRALEQLRLDRQAQ